MARARLFGQNVTHDDLSSERRQTFAHLPLGKLQLFAATFYFVIGSAT